MMKAGDLDSMRVILDWVAGFIPLALARTALLLPDEAGIFFTETVNHFGLYQAYEYGCDAATNRPPGYPKWLEGPGSEGGWVRYDHGGNAPGPEAGLMAIDYFWATQDAAAAAKYIPIATHTLDFYVRVLSASGSGGLEGSACSRPTPDTPAFPFPHPHVQMSHHKNRTSDGKIMLWPTQVLETYWCEWPGWSNCCETDLPQLAAVTSLARNLLRLPAGMLTPAQVAAYSAFEAALPALPTNVDGSLFVPAAVISSGSHNSEVPEVFASHPFRLLTVGAATVDPSVNLSVARATWYAVPNAQANTGWYYGGMAAAYLGLANESYAMVSDRAAQPPPGGYRFPAFAQVRGEGG
jgi:hypothetical protein